MRGSPRRRSLRAERAAWAEFAAARGFAPRKPGRRPKVKARAPYARVEPGEPFVGTQMVWIPWPGPILSWNDAIDAAKGYGGRGLGYAKLKAASTGPLCEAIVAAGVRPFARARFSFQWVELDRRRDPDGFSSGGKKLLLDCLVLAGVMPNDTWKEVLGFDGESWETGPQPGCHLIIRSE